MAGVDPQRLADVDGPDLGPEVRLEVELAADIGPGGLAVLADHDEGGEEDRLEADDHGEESEGELVELERRPEDPDVDEDPDPEPDGVEIHEIERAGEAGDLIGGPILGPEDGVEDRAFVPGLVVVDLVEVAVLDPVRLVDHSTGRAVER